MIGWIKLHRKLTAWEWYGDTNTFRVFMHLLLTVNHEPSKYRGYDVPIGAGVYGLNSLSATLGISIKAIRVALHKLKKSQNVAIETNNMFSIIHVLNWIEYQTGANEGQAKGKPRATLKEDKKKEDRDESDYWIIGKVIKITENEIERWRIEYSNLTPDELDNLIIDRDAWLAKQSIGIQKTWYMSTKSYLKKINETNRATA